jgi:hypothetical protein
MKSKKQYHTRDTVGTVEKAIQKIVVRGKIDTLNL